MLQEIQDLESKVKEREDFERQQRMRMSDRLHGLENQGTLTRKKEIELAKERGEHIATL